MRSEAFVRAPRVRSWVFAVCAGCTLWLLVQNAVLFSLVGWGRLHLPLAPATVAPALVSGVVLMSLAPLAFALGWMVSRSMHRAGRNARDVGRSHHEGARS